MFDRSLLSATLRFVANCDKADLSAIKDEVDLHLLLARVSCETTAAGEVECDTDPSPPRVYDDPRDPMFNTYDT